MSLVRWSPFSELEDILDRYSNVKRNYLKKSDADSNELTVADWAPSVDISEKKDAYNIKAELPGVSKDNVNVTLEQGVLTIRGEKRFEKESDEGKPIVWNVLMGSLYEASLCLNPFKKIKLKLITEMVF